MILPKLGFFKIPLPLSSRDGDMRAFSGIQDGISINSDSGFWNAANTAEFNDPGIRQILPDKK